MLKDWPVGILTVTIWAYWSTVFAMVFYKRLRYGQPSGVFPRNRREKRLWFGVVFVFLAWNILPVLAVLMNDGPFGLPEWAITIPAVYAVRSGAAVLAFVFFMATVSCWLLMGRNWSMAIVPGKKTELVTGGLFGWVRHPIYSLSILMMACSAMVVATIPMLLIAILHFVNMNLKAKNEEEYLTKCHGPSFGAYCLRVGRFIPRWKGLMGR